MPIDRKPAVIVPKLPDVVPTYNEEFRLEVFVPIKIAPSFLPSNIKLPELFLTLSAEAEVAVDEPTTVSMADCVVVPMLTVDEPTYNIFVPELTSVPLTTLNALDEPRIISKSVAFAFANPLPKQRNINPNKIKNFLAITCCLNLSKILDGLPSIFLHLFTKSFYCCNMIQCNIIIYQSFSGNSAIICKLR